MALTAIRLTIAAKALLCFLINNILIVSNLILDVADLTYVST